jgi:arginase
MFRLTPDPRLTVPVNVGLFRGALEVSEAWTWSALAKVLPTPTAANPSIAGEVLDAAGTERFADTWVGVWSCQAPPAVTFSIAPEFPPVIAGSASPAAEAAAALALPSALAALVAAAVALLPALVAAVPAVVALPEADVALPEAAVALPDAAVALPEADVADAAAAVALPAAVVA